jgi:hypothetical protein
LWFFSGALGNFPDKAVKHSTHFLTYLPIRYFSFYSPHFNPISAVAVLWNTLANRHLSTRSHGLCIPFDAVFIVQCK